jgi:hypothetical protein
MSPTRNTVRNRRASNVTPRGLTVLMLFDTAPGVACVLLAATLGLTGCVNATTHQPAHSASLLQNPEEKSAIVIHAYKKDLVGIRTANPDVKLHVDRDPGLAAEPVLFVEYPSATKDPAGRDVHLDTEKRDWTAARAIAFRIRPEHAIRFSVSFMDRNRVVYTAWTQVRAGVWQSVRILFADIRPNSFFQPLGARMGAPIDVGEVRSIGFAPQDTASGRLAISQFVLQN